GAGAGARADLALDPPRRGQGERDGERDDHQQQHVGHCRDDAPPEAHPASSGALKRKPTPRSVCTSRGVPACSPSFLRGPDTCTSRVLVDPYQLVSHTSSISRSRVSTVPALRIRRASSSYFLRVRYTSSPVSGCPRSER